MTQEQYERIVWIHNRIERLRLVRDELADKSRWGLILVDRYVQGNNYVASWLTDEIAEFISGHGEMILKEIEEKVNDELNELYKEIREY